MAEKAERTEQATPRKQAQLRQDGKIARSTDIGGAATLFAVLVAISFGGEKIAQGIFSYTHRIFALQDSARPLGAFSAMVPVLTISVLPSALAAGLAAAAVGAVQARGLFSPQLLMPKWERLSPASHIGRLLPGKQSAVEIGSSLLKVTLLGIVIYRIVAEATPRFALLASVEPEVAAGEVGSVAAKLVLHGALAFAVLAAIDFYLSKRRFDQDTKMSRQEVKDEQKHEEGDPSVRRRMRARMREASKRRSVAEVKNATVLVANPTHVSVALRYDPRKDAAPLVLAKGVDGLALQMRNAARKFRVPIVENRPLARALWAQAKVGRSIPVDLYRAAAEVIAHVMRLKAGGLT